jgi:hypothetical protein
MNPSYEVVYNVVLLDDIHNYFPALLYDTGRFNDITSVFHYVRSQMNSRFNLYSYGSSLFRANNPIVRERVVPPPPTVAQERPVVLRRELDTENLAATALLLSMLGATPLTTPTLGTRVLNAGARAFFPGFNEPVTVRPTREEIEEATETITGLTNQSCAICQDLITVSDNCRRILFCRHTYHRNCIDQWFERNVRCPVCRHDIRDIDQETP